MGKPVKDREPDGQVVRNAWFRCGLSRILPEDTGWRDTMRHRHQGMLLLALLLVLPQGAAAHETPDLTRIEVHSPTYDSGGRRIRDDMKRFDAEGFLVGTVSSSWVYDRAGRIQTSETVTMDADGVPTHA